MTRNVNANLVFLHELCAMNVSIYTEANVGIPWEANYHRTLCSYAKVYQCGKITYFKTLMFSVI